jgi:tripartite-type tricarboxylate transporter receptor subunit TctC
MAKVDIAEIPYKSSGQALTDVMGGDVLLNYPSMAAVLPHIRSGRVKPLAVSGAKRSAALPDVPAMAEFLPGYEASGWYGILVPISTPADLVSRLSKEIVSVVNNAEVREKMSSQGAEVMGSTPEVFAKFMREGRDKWDDLIRQLKIPLL